MSGPVPGGIEPALQLAGAAVGEVAATVRGGSTGYLVLCTSIVHALVKNIFYD